MIGLKKMATDKTFTVVGVSKLKGEYKVRFANDIMRVKVLNKGGHEDVRLVELDEPLNKLDAVLAIKNMTEFADVGAQTAFLEYVDRNVPVSKPESTPTATKTKAVTTTAKVSTVTPQVPALKGMTPLGLKDVEDAPF
jgi:hypothetical protein